MAIVEVDDTLWAEFCALSKRFEMPDSGEFLEWCLRRTIKFENVVDGRYVPVSCAIVTRNETEILVVGNEYARGQPLYWNLPGGAVDPGEDLRRTVARELHEESGIEALEIGRLAWIVQTYDGPDHPGFLAFAFEVTAWQGDITLEYEEKGGYVRRAEFVSYDEACKRILSASAVPLRDWLTESRDAPCIYWNDGTVTSAEPRLMEQNEALIDIARQRAEELGITLRVEFAGGQEPSPSLNEEGS